MRHLSLTLTVLASLILTAPAAHADEPVDPASRMLLVLDSSGSMAEKTPDGTPRIDAAKDALRRVIDKLPDNQEVGLRVYGAEVFSRNDAGACTDSQLIVKPATGNRDDLTSALDNYKPYGETPIGHALAEAGKDLGTEGPRTIVLVSDGEPNCDPDPCTVAQDLTKNGIDVRIDVVGLNVTGTARDKLRCIADNGNGTYYDVDSADELVRSLDTSTTRATRPFDFTGTPIKGTENWEDAPLMTAPGQYLDTFAGGDGVWYKVERTVPGSTIHAGIAHPSQGTGNSGDKAYLAVHVEGGNRCDYSTSFARGNLAYTSERSYRSDPDNPCNTADTLWINVKEYGQSAKLPGKPVEIVVYEEPPLADGADRELPPQPDKPEWETPEVGDPVTDVVPGTSISSAPVVKDGTYAFDINPGETQVVAVPLDWGQNLQAQFDGVITDDHRKDLFSFKRPWVQVLGPLRQAIDTDDIGVASKPDDWTDFPGRLLRDTTEFRTGSQSYTIGYRNRTEIEEHQSGASIAGLRYVQVSFPADNDGPMEYTLTLKTNGEPQAAPEYAEVDGLTPPVADSPLVGGTGTTAGAQTADETEAVADTTTDGDGLPWLPIGLGAAGALALAGAGLLLVRRRGGD